MRTPKILTSTFLLGLLLCPGARADSIWAFTNTSYDYGYWNYSGFGSNWNGGIPNSSTYAIINNGFRAELSSSDPQGGGLGYYNRLDIGTTSGGGGELDVYSGAVLSGTTAYLGASAGSYGNAYVSGTGAQWNNSGYLLVGNSGSGYLDISFGGKVTSGGSGKYSVLGNDAGSTGRVQVVGTGSQWTINDNLYVGGGGNGALSIYSGGKVTNANGIIASSGTSTSSVIVGAGAVWQNSGEIDVGNAGNGTLIIQTGGSVTSSHGFIGAGAGSSGNATVTGTGSQWTLSNYLRVGGNGTGSLTISVGGKVSNVNNVGMIGFGNTGTATVTGIGSQWVNSNLSVGYNNTGTLNIQAGGLVTTGSAYLGDSTGGVGTLTVNGIGSQLADSGNLFVGYSGSGTMNVQSGGVVNNVAARIGYSAGKTGMVTVDGTGSQWNSSADLYVGASGGGTLTIQNGGKVSDTHGYVAALSGSTGTATVTGAGSQWMNSGQLHVGEAGNGILNVQNGGVVSVVANAFIGVDTGTGNTTVTGAGSLLSTSSILYVGANSNGTLTIDAGGKVTAATRVGMADSGSSTGTLNLNGTAGSRGVLETTFISENAGTGGGHINFNGGILRVTGTQASLLLNFETGDVQIQSGGAFVDSNGFNVGISTALQGAGGLNKQGAGTLTLSVAHSFTGASTVEAGVLEVTASGALGTIAAGTTVNSGAALKLTGVNYSTAEALTLNGSGIVNGGALVNSGTSTFAGQITAATNASISAGGGTLNLIGGLVKNGTVLTLTGGGTINVSGTGISGASANSDLVVDGVTLNENVANSYNGPTFIRNGGILNANVANALPTSPARSALIFDDTGTGASKLVIGADQQAASLTGAASSKIDLTSRTLTVGTTGGSTTFAGSTGSGGGITGTGSLIKDGTSTQIFTGSNAFSGDTQVNGGTLQISSGGSVSNAAGYIGFSSGNDGTLTVTGTGSQWSNSGVLRVGNSGKGTMNILAGGTVTSGVGIVGTLPGSSTSTVTVNGTGSAWNLGSNELRVGFFANGALNIQSGGTVTSGIGTIGLGDGITGTVNVTGTGSLWNASSISVNAGNSPTVATLTVDAGGRVEAGFIYASFGGTGTGTININGTPGSRGVVQVTSRIEQPGSGGYLNINGGTLLAGANTSDILRNFQSGHVQILSRGMFMDTQGFNVGISAPLQGAGGLTKQSAGKLTLTGASTYTGVTTVEAGTLALGIGGSVTSSSRIHIAAGATLEATTGITLGTGQTLSGSGTVAGSVVVNGILAPGNSPGILTTGSETWNGGGIYSWEFASATGTAGVDWDFLNVLGGVNFAATSGNKFTIDINGNLAGILPSTVLDWTILHTTDGFGGTFSADEFAFDLTDFTSNIADGRFSLVTRGNDLVLEFSASPSAVPEPAPGLVALAVCGFAALLPRRRRQAAGV